MSNIKYSGNLPYWTEEMLDKLFQVSVQLNYKKGSTVLHPLMANESLFLVLSGVVHYRYFSKDGDAITISQVRQGELFGIKSILSNEDERRYFYIVADTDVSLLKISRENFLNLMESDFEFTKGIMRYFVHHINSIERKIMRSAILGNYQNMVLTLLDYAEDIKENTAVVQMTQQNLADLLTISRQSVSAYLSSMTKQGLISVKRGRIYILEWDALNMELL